MFCIIYFFAKKMMFFSSLPIAERVFLCFRTLRACARRASSLRYSLASARGIPRTLSIPRGCIFYVREVVPELKLRVSVCAPAGLGTLLFCFRKWHKCSLYVCSQARYCLQYGICSRLRPPARFCLVGALPQTPCFLPSEVIELFALAGGFQDPETIP